MILWSVLPALAALLTASAAVVYVQPGNANYVGFEADIGPTILPGTPETWVSTNNAAASGGAVLYAAGENNTGTSPHSFAQYSIKFATAGTYFLYYRWMADPARTAGDAFTANSSWFGTTFGAYSTPGDQAPFYRSDSNGAQAPADNTLAWRREPEAQTYTVTAAEVAAPNPVVFTLGTREAGMSFDRIVFSTDPALTDAQLDALFNTPTDVVMQKPGDNYAAFEAEGAKAKIIPGTPETWVSTNNAAASGGAVLYAAGENNTGTSPHSFAQYSIKFATAGTYFLYYRWMADPARTAGDAFTANSSWFGTTFGAYSTPGDQAPFYRSDSNGAQAPADNTLAWRREPEAQTYTVTAAEVAAANPVVFSLGTREAGMGFDRIVFSTDPALTDAQLDGLVNSGSTAAAPKIAGAVGSPTLNTATIAFTRPLASSSVNTDRFAINNGLTVTAATLDAADARIVQLTTSAQIQGTTYTVTVNGVTDTTGTPIAPDSTVNFTAWKLAPGWVLKEIFFNVQGNTVADFTAFLATNPAPSRVQWVKGFQLNDDPLTDNYGARLTAFFRPSAPGSYNFYPNNDDEAELFLSTDESAGNLQSIGLFALSPRRFDESIFGASPGSLSTGRNYLLQGLLKQVGGAVYLNVAAKRPSDPQPVDGLSSLSGAEIATFVNPDFGSVVFKQVPTNTTAIEGHRARFSVVVETAEAPVYYQWRANGVTIDGATRSVFTTAPLTGADSGKTYDVVVSVAGRETPSSTATLTVVGGDAPAEQPYLGINFVGGGTSGGDALRPIDVAGVVPQSNWNNLDGFVFDPATTPQNLLDAAGAASPVTLTATLTEVWYSGARSAGGADGALLQGFVDSQALTDPITFTWQGVPAGNYQVLVYSLGFDFSANYYQSYALAGGGAYPIYHGKSETGLGYVAKPAFRRMVSTTHGSEDVGNYVQFDNVNPAADGSLILTVTWDPPDTSVSNGHQPAINALQLVRIVPVVSKPSLSVSSTGGSVTVGWTASATGFVLQSSSALGAGGIWTTVSGAPNPIAGPGSISVNPAGSGATYYRLVK